ncbi:hypothetical protein [Pseudorhodobacter sp.]|uniref:hypothetical protein n=1 Tax=Pseudorhodobacter sp. TaxID=1934400 RepID=UPI002AFDEF25|nr:hypothetical protein [Pseudorhodobacter sp.]
MDVQWWRRQNSWLGKRGPELAVPDLRRQVVRASAAAWPGKWCHRELGGDTDKPENEALWRYGFG